MAEVTSSELVTWYAYNRLSPVSDERQDWLFSKLEASVCAPWSRDRINAKDLLPVWDSDRVKLEQIARAKAYLLGKRKAI